MTFAWTDMAVDELKRLHTDPDLSCSQIAAQLMIQFGGQLTRNSIIGKSGRLGLPRKKAATRGPTKPKANPAEAAALRELRRRLKKDARRAIEAEVEATDLPPDQSDRAVDLMRLEDQHCRFPLGEPSHEMFYCGADKDGEHSYCRRHWRLTHKPPRPANHYAFRGR